MPDPAAPAPAAPESAAVPDSLLFTRIVAHAAAETGQPLSRALGLSRSALARLVDRHAPAFAATVAALPADAGPGEDELEETDLRALVLEHRAGAGEEEEWLAAIVARRSMGGQHLWQDMGFANRGELNAMFRRHFPALVAANAADMKWKKFFYRQLCAREGFLLCKSPNCEQCDDRAECFAT
ncbi:nitrogen fixation protein NifQ [Azospirillum halopraeferens]|uniref:nitrogen fixation protein NifQ n=1 Tax=Azospirillum halopraeferens TaxID=34010 RepID=UPI000688FC60|nr:nitrogen fixation protein NifQ [Azospirillum halopraeferens]